MKVDFNSHSPPSFAEAGGAPPGRDALAVVRFDSGPVRLEDVVALARRQAQAELSPDSAFRALIHRGAAVVDRMLEEDGVIYGVTTGYGDSCDVAVPRALAAELPHRLLTYHGCGLGVPFSAQETRAILAARLASLCKGFSGVGIALLDGLAGLLRADILPVIPSEGSVGASGDLTPLSYVAAALCGEREAVVEGQRMPAGRALAAAGMMPLRLRPKEGLAIMNGTAAMTGLACLATARADYLVRLTTRIASFAAVALDGNRNHFDSRLFALKPHAGMQRVAHSMAHDLGVEHLAADRNSARLQDRYSIRCAPHVIGVLADALPWMRTTVENELNSVNDNPVVDPESGRVMHGGHFYGGHIAFVMDSMKNAVANLADLMDRQLALLVDARYSNGLAANLSGAEGARLRINHGLKALQISVSAWTAEALKLTMPASVFSRSTECHNQDKVSMGTIAARDCVRVLELTEQVAAAMLIAVRQGLALRGRSGASLGLSGEAQTMLDALEGTIAFVDEDRRLDEDLIRLLALIRNEAWALTSLA